MAAIENTQYALDVAAPPHEVLLALTDFGPMRPQIWPETSHPRVYRLHELMPTGADVTEGVPFTWSRERYDWSEAGTLLLTQVESNVSRNGTIRYRLLPHNGGTRVTCDRHREFYGLQGRVAWAVMNLAGASILRRQLRNGIARSAQLRSVG